MSRTERDDPLTEFRSQLQSFIKKNYSTVEQFCWDTDLNKATVSNFLRGKKDFQVSTLQKIAGAMKKSLSIRVD